MVSRVVGVLVDSGLVHRIQNPDDLRAGVVEITPEGAATHERIKEARGAVLSEYLNRLSPEDRSAIFLGLPALEALAAELGTVGS
jgi:DNA-binding MarR family transcriptional regulator